MNTPSNPVPPPSTPPIVHDQPDFSLVLGGPLFQLFRRAHLSGDALELVRRRVFVIAALAWVPLLLLSLYAGNALGSAVKIPFLHDVEVQVRFLVALPILIAAELVVHERIRPVVRQFLERHIIIPSEIPKFHDAIHATMRVRNSLLVEVGLIVLVYTVGLWIWRSQIAMETASWYAVPDGPRMRLTLAGYWFVFISVPLFQFLLLRWYLRFALWFMFLWRVARLNLRLVAVHPDRAAGLGFLGKSAYAFGPILFAQGALLAALIASQIFYADKSLMSFKTDIAAFIVFFVAAVLSPLTVFAPHLARAKRLGSSEISRLASRYGQAFEGKWMAGNAPADQELLGSADIQSLADLGNSYAVVQEMRPVPFSMKDVTSLIAHAAIPLLPLLLTILSVEELVSRLIKIIF